MTVAHPVQKRRVPRNAPRLCGSVRREVEKHLAQPAGSSHGPAKSFVKRLPGVASSPRQGACAPGLKHVPKKLLDFFDKDLLQGIDFERFLVDHMEPCDRQGIAQIVLWRLTGGDGARFHPNDRGEVLVK
jgi:hypothetical protein